MTARECIVGRRSIRRFTDRPVPHSVLEEIVAVASYAPSWKNTQITRYVALENEKKERFAPCVASFPHNEAILSGGAPMVVAVTILKGRSGVGGDGSYSTRRGDSWKMFDAGIASEAFCLAAYEQGLGTVIIGSFDDEKAAALLELPQDREVAALIAIGYPAEAPASPRRKAVAELLSYP
ncbi:MAG: nitroreductase family protein [Clostridium sp.]|jgi:nitroreductase|nr:nitroreductase family protein [Clostridium sp.]